jgi:hypothetical protein
MRAAPAHPLLVPPTVAQVQVAGQSESRMHDTAFGSQCFVVDGVQVQSGGGIGIGAGLALGSDGGGFAPPGSEGGVGVPGAGVGVPVLGAPAEPDDEPDGAVPVPLLPLHPHASGSGTQLNPAPQLASLAQGNSYSGVHFVTVTVVQSEGGVGGTTQSAFGGHAGAGSVGHDVIAVDPMQTMPSAQSLCAVQGPGTHSLICVFSQGGGAGHAAPSGQKLSPQPSSATT